VLRSGETAFEYGREVQPHRKLGRWMAELGALLAGNTVKPAREQLTLIRVFEELRERGYEGGYDAVRRYARRWASERASATPPTASLYRELSHYTRDRPSLARSGRSWFPERTSLKPDVIRATNWSRVFDRRQDLGRPKECL